MEHATLEQVDARRFVVDRYLDGILPQMKHRRRWRAFQTMIFQFGNGSFGNTSRCAVSAARAFFCSELVDQLEHLEATLKAERAEET